MYLDREEALDCAKRLYSNGNKVVAKKVLQLIHERDALMKTIKGDCLYCTYYQSPTTHESNCAIGNPKYPQCWKWKGIQEEYSLFLQDDEVKEVDEVW